MAQNDIEIDVSLKGVEKSVEQLKPLQISFETMQKGVTQLGATLGGVFNNPVGVVRFNANLDSVAKKTKTVGKESTETAEDIKELGEQSTKSAKKLSFMASVFKDMTEGFEKRLTIFASYKAIAVATDALTNSLQSIVDLQREFANIQAIVGNTDSQMSSLKDTIFEVGNSTRYTVEELAQATVTLGQAGLGSAQIDKALKSTAQLASATGTDLATSVNVMTSALSVWNLEASQASRVADTMTTAMNKTKAEISTMANAIQYAGATASDLGVSFEEFTAIASAVTNAGLKARAVVGTGFRATLTELVKPTEKLQKVFDRLGISMEDVDVQGRGFQNVLKTLKESGFGAAEAFEGLGREATTWFLAATSQLDTITDLRSAFLEQGSTMKANEKQMTTLSAQFVRFGNTSKEVVFQGLEPLVTALTKTLTIFNDILSSDIGKWIQSNVIQFGALTLLWTRATLILKGLWSGILALGVGMKKAAIYTSGYTAATSVATKSTKTLTVAVNMLKFALRSLLAPLLIFGAIELFSNMKSSTEKIEDLNEVLNKNDENINSLQSAYEELITKQRLYENDNDALVLKIQELNNTFGDLGFRLDLTTTKYQDLTKAVLAFQQQQYEEKGRSISEQQKLLDPQKASLQFINESSPVKGGLNSKFKDYNKFFERVQNASNQEILEIQDELNKMEGNEYKYYKEIFRRASEFNKNAKELASISASSELSDSTVKLLTKTTTTVDNLLDKYKKDLKLALEGGESKSDNVIEGVQEVRDAANLSIRAELDKVTKQIEVEKSKGVLPDAPSRKTLASKQLNIQNELSKLNEENEDLVIKLVEGDFKSAQATLKDLTKRIGTGRINQSNESLLKQVDSYVSTLQEAAGNQLDLDIKEIDLPEGSKAFKDEVYRLTKESNERVATIIAEVSEATFDYVNGFEKVRESLKAAKQSVDTLDSELEGLEREGDFKKLKGAELRASGTKYVSEALGSSLSTILQDTIEEATQALVPQMIKNRSSQVGELKSTLGGVESERKRLELLKAEQLLIQKNASTPGERLAANKNLESIQKELNEAKSTELELTTAIRDRQNEIYELQYARRVNAEREGIRNDTTFGSFNVGVADAATEMYAANKELRSMESFLEGTGVQSFNVFTEGFSTMVQEFEDGSKSFKDALKDFTASTLDSLGKWLIDLGIKMLAFQAIKAMFMPGLGTTVSSSFVGPLMPGTSVGLAKGGYVSGGTPNRDSVHAKLMPGEFVLKKSAADMLGANFLNSLNSNTAQTMDAMATPGVVGVDSGKSEGSVVNVWVVSEKGDAQMGPNDIIATVSKNITTGGTLKTLIKSVKV